MPLGLVWELASVERPFTMDLIWMVITHYYCIVRITCILCGFAIVLGGHRSHMGGSDDMKSLVFICGVRVDYCGTHICFWLLILYYTVGFFTIVLSCNRI